MSAYVLWGYVIGLGTITAYAVTLVARERRIRRRLRLAKLDVEPDDQREDR